MDVDLSGAGNDSDSREAKAIGKRFYRIDKSRSRETGGTGLGLAILKQIADTHDADFVVDSEPGKGTCITVSF